MTYSLKLLLLLVLYHEFRRIISTPCIPRAGKVALIVGQDYGSIMNYTTIFSQIHFRPFGFMTYTTLNGSDGQLAGLENAIDYGSGIEWTEGIVQRFPRSSIQLGLYLVNQLEAINSGIFDPIIVKLVNYVKGRNLIADFYLRIGYEFDNAGNHYSPNLYQLAFRRIVRIFHENKVDNVAFVWHSMGEVPFGQNLDEAPDYSRWFPGTEFVDLCGVSIFQQPFHCSPSHSTCVMKYIESFSQFCKDKNIPLMIAESTPFGGIITKSQEKEDPSIKNRAGYSGNSWEVWFTPVLNYIHDYDVRIWSYINCDWDMFPMWQKNHDLGIFWGDSRVEGKPFSINVAFNSLICS